MLEDLSCSDNELVELPPLPAHLEYLSCSHNQLTELPPLPPTLKFLYASFNRILRLPSPLPIALKDINCNNNELRELPQFPPVLNCFSFNHNHLRELPRFPDTLKYINCSHNQLVILPKLPDGLIQVVDVRGNPLIYRETTIECIRESNRILYSFRNLFHSLKWKRRFRSWLWERVREPKIMKQYHPSKINELLEQGIEIEDLESYF
jgi:hypothetical protein